jgi:S-adenosylmethionine:tRNA ribosyltransferase-isomerase
VSAVATLPVDRLALGFTLDEDHVAHEAPERRGVGRDEVRLLVSAGHHEPVHARFHDLRAFLAPGDLLVVNDSATVPAAIDARADDGRTLVVHVSTELPGHIWMVEPRTAVSGGATEPFNGDLGGVLGLADGTPLLLLARAPGSRRLWLASAEDLPGALARVGRPIRYRYVHEDHPLSAYQTVFAKVPGSAEMPSAARPFTPSLVTGLAARGIGIAAITLHTGVSSLENHELPYPERFDVPSSTAARVNATRRSGGLVVAVGTTVVRALESAVDSDGEVHAATGWTDLVVTPDHPVRAVDGMVTGWHEPEGTHLLMLEAVADRDVLVAAYRSAWANGYRWHEFGDSHLLLPYAGRR